MVSISLDGTAYGVNEIQTLLSQHNFNISNLIFDGDIHRFDRLSKLSGWYVARKVETELGSIPIVVAGDWVTNEKHKFIPKKEWTSNQKDIIHRQIQIAQQEEGRRREEKNVFAANQAREMWELADPARISPYMQKKGFASNFGCRVDKDGVLLIPTVVGEELFGLEKIFPDGIKRYLPGQRMKGCYFVIGHIARASRTYIVEGFATGVSIHLATNRSVIVAFSASNLIDVCKHFHRHNIVIAADNDRFTANNPGITAAQKASVQHNFPWIAPEFRADDEEGTDFNDLATKMGAEEVKRQLEGQMQSSDSMPNQTKAHAENGYKLTPVEVYKQIADMINNESREYANFKERFFVTEPEKGSYVLVEETEPGLACVVNITRITACLIKHLNQHMAAWRMFSLDVDAAKKAVLYWTHITKPIPSPLLIGQKSTKEMCFHRLPWDYEEAYHAIPRFDEFISRCSNGDALKIFIGSLFEPLSDRSQYIWLSGDGADGKGTLTTMLGKIFGPVFCTPGVPASGDSARFWTSQLHKKRLAVMSECEDAKFLTSALLKSITGNDAINFEKKGQPIFSEKPEVKLLLSSNYPAQVTRSRAHQRRLISCAVEAPLVEVGNLVSPHIMDAEWWAEAPAIVNHCIKMYRLHCPTFGPIPTEILAYEEALEESEIYFDGVFHNYFAVDRRGSVSGAVMEAILDKCHMGYHDKRLFRDYMKKKHGLTKQRFGVGMVWIGIEKKSVPDATFG